MAGVEGSFSFQVAPQLRCYIVLPIQRVGQLKHPAQSDMLLIAEQWLTPLVLVMSLLCITGFAAVSHMHALY